jgi:two-component system chemotaxis response regulator CheB
VIVVRRKIKVLIVDDSSIVRKILSDTISVEPDMEVVGTAPDPYVARDKILALAPDVVTLDIEMPRMDGLTFLRKLMMYYPLPVIIVSSLGDASCTATREALQCGAVEVLSKPAGAFSVSDLRRELASKIRAAALSHVRPPAEVVSNPVSAGPTLSHLVRGVNQTQGIIAIGASTGGTRAIQDILMQLPASSPGMVVTQHIPAGFSLAFANRLNKMSSIEVKEAVDGDKVMPGRVLIAPGDFHLLLRRSDRGYFVEVQKGAPICYQRPSVDVMFASVAQIAGKHAIGILLTGMGTDGARGLLALRHAGAFTIAQDETSCVVYGMPREAIRINAVERVASLSDIPRILVGINTHGRNVSPNDSH